jgi:hypothetical protein
LTTTEHPSLSRIIQAETDRLLNIWGRVGTDRIQDEGYTLIFGLSEDVQHGVTKVYHESGRVER